MKRGEEYALVTGGWSGIGFELAREFARHGYNLILVARTRDRLEAAARQIAEKHGVDCRAFAADLSLTSNVERVYQYAWSGGLPVTVLVNDAGVGRYGPFCEGDFPPDDAMIRLNITGLTQLCKLFGRDMQARGSGRILNVASVVGMWPVPNMAVYAATKAYVISFSQALSSELRGSGVQVSVLCPNVVATNFLGGHEKAAPCGMVARLVYRMEKARYLPASAVAAAGYSGLMKGQRRIVPNNLAGRAVVLGMKVLPRDLVADLRARRKRGRA